MDPKHLEGVPLFAGLPHGTLERIARLSEELDVPAGKELAHEGRFAHEFFVILEGRAQVTQAGAVLRELGPGDFFGEIGLLESERRTATVTSTTPMRLAVLFEPGFRHVEASEPEIARAVRTAIRDRLARSAQAT